METHIYSVIWDLYVDFFLGQKHCFGWLYLAVFFFIIFFFKSFFYFYSYQLYFACANSMNGQFFQLHTIRRELNCCLWICQMVQKMNRKGYKTVKTFLIHTSTFISRMVDELMVDVFIFLLFRNNGITTAFHDTWINQLRFYENSIEN